MTRTDTGRNPAAASLDHLLESHHIRLGGAHRSRLQWLMARFGDPVVWERDRPGHGGRRLIIVAEPPTGPDVEFLYRALHSKCVVVIPFGENPAFDFLKSKLKDFGTIGPCGADGPHELWWGGLSWSVISNGDETARAPLVVSCYPADTDQGAAVELRRALASLQLDFVVEAVNNTQPEQLLGVEKARFILDAWETHQRPILWVEPDAVVLDPPSLLAKLDCDFAVHKWNRCELSARTLYFGRSEAAEALLRTWHELSSNYSGVWDGYVLDQAWSLVGSQRALDTVWLPHSYHATAAARGPRNRPVIIHDVDAAMSTLGPDLGFPKSLRAARRASRTGAPESLIVIKSREAGQGAVTVILNDIRSTGSRMVAESIEAITAAFDRDPGGFDHLELSLCAWQEDVKAVTSAAKLANNRILEIAPSKELSADMFRRLAEDKPALGRVVRLSGADPGGGASHGHL